jgi:hypothetical protein
MTEQATENGFAFATPQANAVFAEVLARKPADTPLSEWARLLGLVTNAFLDHRLVWYWDLDTGAWVPGVIGDGGTQDGAVVFDVDLCHGGPLRWGYEWQFVPLVSLTEPAAPPDLAKVAP